MNLARANRPHHVRHAFASVLVAFPLRSLPTMVLASSTRRTLSCVLPRPSWCLLQRLAEHCRVCCRHPLAACFIDSSDTIVCVADTLETLCFFPSPYASLAALVPSFLEGYNSPSIVFSRFCSSFPAPPKVCLFALPLSELEDGIYSLRSLSSAPQLPIAGG